jgi:NTE family protein
VGLVLGGGGVLGAAWMAGALTAVQKKLAEPIGSADLVIGTSAGSILAAVLRAGIDVETLVAHQRGAELAGLPELVDLDREHARGLPPLPRLRLGSPRLLLNAALAPHRMHPWVAASALLPIGRGHHAGVERLVTSLEVLPGDYWPRGRTWIMAVDYWTGRRIAFGRPGAPSATVIDAVVASCSIPGWYRPRTIGGRQYVDGGVRSSTSLDLLVGEGLDEVYVLAPMASVTSDKPRNPAVMLERQIRRRITAGLLGELAKVEAAGTKVTVLTPGPEDLEAIGVNLMDPARRQRVLETSLRTSAAALPSFNRPSAA